MADYDSVIPPGGSGTLKAKVHTKPTQSGRLLKGITVRTDAPGAESLNLSLAMEIYTPIVIKPRYQVYLNSMVGETTSARVLLARTDNKPLEVTVKDSGNSDVTVSATQVKKPEETKEGFTPNTGDVWLEVTSSNPKAVGSQTSKIVLTTNHPDMQELILPLTVRTRALIEARPGEVRMFVNSGVPSNRSMLFRVSHNGGKTFELASVTCSAPDFFNVTVDKGGEAQAHQVRVELNEDADLSGLEFPYSAMITIQTSDKKSPVVTVPITLIERSARRIPPRRSKTARPPVGMVRPTGTPGVG